MFESIYSLFSSFFGYSLDDYLYGFTCSQETMASNQYIMYGMVALGSALFGMILFYYIINHPRFNKVTHWLIILLLVALLNLLFGGIITSNDLSSLTIPECFITNDSGGITTANCWMFGLANAIVAICFFIVFSIVGKWWSTNCKCTPF